ncbi:transcription antitermination factor NusB [Azospirillum thermophilum]|uniref:Transcription antitermination protein NusB n=1 Tax=Azospirillum thermophilum TaxID=2202148 RepID=A0A2S2CQS4_9PROT|nr:transcription antitermination factor NusB [Azospirillum thermophilum]AWK86861.1 transcription antitermination factor NusB [Azospirillum thermophilum]
MSNDDAAGRAKTKRGSRNRTGGGSAKARRKAARLAAVQALYQIDLSGAAVETVVGEFIKHRLGEEIDGAKFVAGDPQLFSDIVRGASHRRSEVDGILASALDPRFPLDRLELLLRAILRAGAYEMFAHMDVHPRILISEYVDVARAFYSQREPAMVNGVLDHVARALRAEDLAKPDPSRAGAEE